MKIDTIADVVRKAEQDYQAGNTQLSDHVTFSLKDNIAKIDAYLNSKHVSGETDSMGREKPFFNIVTAAVNIWYRATDIDRKNIRIKATRAEQYMLAFIANIHLQEWMRRSSFGVFLNDWGRSLARYGSSVLKFVEKDGELHCEVVPWNRLICDPIDFNNGVKIEKLYLTPSQLRQRKGYDKQMVEDLIENSTTTRKTLNKTTKDNKSDFIEIYEVHGELPLSYLTEDEEDDETYVQQIHVLSLLTRNESGSEYDEYCLYSGRESRDPYMITHLIKEDGRTQAIGAVENLFEAQWMVNHTAKTIKDQLDLASKLIFQTSDGNFVGRNALSSIESGDILIHGVNQPLTQLNDSAPNIGALQSYGQQWQSLGNQINGISEAMMGANPPSGTAWRQTQALLQESHSLFEIMTENKGLAIEEIMRERVIPHLLKKMDTSEEISATLDSYQIKQIDSRYIPQEAVRIHNEIIKHDILNGKIAQQPDLEQIKQTLQDAQNAFGNQRFIKPDEVKSKTWKQVLKNFEWEVEVDVTGEAMDGRVVMDTLNTTLQVVANPTFSQNRRAQMIVDRILAETGVLSPIEMAGLPSPMQPTPTAPPGAAQVGAGVALPSSQ